jgi:uncharacterized protein (DUF1499 family)
VLIPVLAALAFLIARRDSLSKPTTFSQTDPDHEESLLRTRHYKHSRDRVSRLASEILPTLRTYGRKWRLVETKAASQTTILNSEVPVLVFTDDLVVTIQDAPDESCLLDVKSSARVGRGDFGENRLHVLQFLQAIDSKLGYNGN